MPIIGFLFIAAYLFTAGLVFEELPLWMRNWWAIMDGYLNNNLENWLYFLVVISIGLLISFRTLYLSYLNSNNRYKNFLDYYCLFVLLHCTMFI